MKKLNTLSLTGVILALSSMGDSSKSFGFSWDDLNPVHDAREGWDDVKHAAESIGGWVKSESHKLKGAALKKIAQILPHASIGMPPGERGKIIETLKKPALEVLTIQLCTNLELSEAHIQAMRVNVINIVNNSSAARCAVNRVNAMLNGNQGLMKREFHQALNGDAKSLLVLLMIADNGNTNYRAAYNYFMGTTCPEIRSVL